MTSSQKAKIMKVALITTIVMLFSEIIFSINAVNDWFQGLIMNTGPIWSYIFLWVIMFLQVTILNIPAYVLLLACSRIGMDTLSFTYVAIVLSAYMMGCICAYFIGKWWGSKAVKWCAGSEEDYNKWSDILNTKGKWWYFATVIFPFFPDDLLCIVAGSVNFNFGFYTIANLIGRGIGLVTMLFTLKLINVTSSSFPYMIIVWSLAVIVEFILMKKFNKEDSNNDGRNM